MNPIRISIRFRMRTIGISLLLLFFSTTIFSQSSKLDSIERVEAELRILKKAEKKMLREKRKDSIEEVNRKNHEYRMKHSQLGVERQPFRQTRNDEY